MHFIDDSNWCVLIICLQISHLDLMQGSQKPFLVLSGGTLALTRMSFKLFPFLKPIIETSSKTFLCSLYIHILFQIHQYISINPCKSHTKDLFLESGLVPSWKILSGYKMSVLSPSLKMNVHGREHQKVQKLYLKNEKKKWHGMKKSPVFN